MKKPLTARFSGFFMSAIRPQRSSLQNTPLLRESQLLFLNSFAETSATVWAEIDIEKGTWSIPAERMKAKRFLFHVKAIGRHPTFKFQVSESLPVAP